MRVVVCTELGPPEKLRIEERPDLIPGPGQVVIDVHACGLNFVDTLFIQGLYQIKPEPPFVPGSEVAGVISAVGDGVSDFAIGDRVLTMCGLNGFADQVAAPAKHLLRLPEKLDFERASAFMQSYCTSLFALDRRANLRAGESVLVLGAAGGVGMAAIDIAKSMGATVIAAASTKEKLEACLAQGADEVIRYTEEDLKTRAKELSGGGVDVVFDPVGDRFAEPALRSLAPGGRYLVIGFAAGDIPRVPFNLILLKQCQVVGVDWGGWSNKNRAGNDALFQELTAMIDAGELSPSKPACYPFEEAGAALRALMDRKVIGKAVLRVRP